MNKQHTLKTKMVKKNSYCLNLTFNNGRFFWFRTSKNSRT